MRVFSDNSFRPLSASSVVTIGNFDGVHLGHRALIERCIREAEKDQEVAVVTFDPLPQAWFAPGRAPARLSSTTQKLDLLGQSGVDLVWMMRFNQELAQMKAETFARSVLAEALSASMVVVGNDFRFGHAREGDLDMLARLGKKFGFRVVTVADVETEGLKVSSTSIREALARGNFDLAERLLGRRFTVQGEVIRGSRLGHDLGYPTANMRPEAEPCPLAGVFAVHTRRLADDAWQDAVASLGVRPVVGGKEFLVEVHLFDFDGDLYGQRLEVDFLEKIRDEQNFPTVDDLVAQMKRDDKKAREILAEKADWN